MRLLWLPAVLRAAGLIVHEVDGWKTRGRDTYGPVRGITCHHTAGSHTSTDQGEIRVLLNGSSSAPPPIAQLYLSRTGHWHVIASGLCYHNKIGWGGPNKGYGNDSLLGIEAQHSGGDEPWTDTQYRSYVRGVAALVAHKATGWSVPVAHVAGHKEHQPGAKFDPTFGMDRFRADVALLLAGEDDVSVEDVKKALETADLVPAPPAGPLGNADAATNTTWRLPYALGQAVFAGRLATRQQIPQLLAGQAELKNTLAALLAAVQGEGTAEILSKLDQLAQAEADRAAAEQQRDADLRALVERGLSGELDAAEVVRLIGERLTGTTAPPAG